MHYITITFVGYYRKQQVTNGLNESRTGEKHGGVMYCIVLYCGLHMPQLESKISNELATLKQGIETMEKVLQLSNI